MKIFFVFFISCLAFALAETSENDGEKAVEDCRKEVEDPSNLGCVYHCAHKKLGFMNADDSVNLDQSTNGNLSLLVLQALKVVHKACVSSAIRDPCKVSLCLEQVLQPTKALY